MAHFMKGTISRRRRVCEEDMYQFHAVLHAADDFRMVSLDPPNIGTLLVVCAHTIVLQSVVCQALEKLAEQQFLPEFCP